MSTILTDDDVDELTLGRVCTRSAARAIEAAVLAKLAQQADRQRVPEGWVNAVQKIADENEVEPLFVTMVFDDLLPVFMADKDAAGYVTLPLDSLIENDSYGVYGSDFYRCKVCGAESGAGVLNKGIQHNHNCPLAAAPEAPAQASAVDERAAFEAWAKAYGRVFLEVEPKLGRNGVTYKNQFTQEAWVGWQARAALAQKGGAA